MIVPETISNQYIEDGEERPFDWDGEIHQIAMSEAFVVDVSNNKAYFAITHHDSSEDEGFQGASGDSSIYTSAGLYKRWSNQFPGIYRDLLRIVDTEYPATIPEPGQIDDLVLESDAPDLAPGDFVHIHRLLLWEKARETGGRAGHFVTEVCKQPRANESPEAFFERTTNLRPRIARQLARTIAKREEMHMHAQNRLTPNEPYRPFTDLDSLLVPTDWNGIKGHFYRSRNVFGTGPVKDHFVDITAKPASDYHTELGGQQSFTANGRHLFTPNVIPFGEGSSDDPLYIIKVSISSDTVFSPAVGEQSAHLTIDGRKYTLLKDREQSSYYFEQPGHDVVFEGVREEGIKTDTYEITPEQSNALAERHLNEMQATSSVMRQDYADFLAGKDTMSLAELHELIERRVQALRAEANAINETIASIVGREPTHTISDGAHLLVPRSMLDSIEITLSGIE